MTAGCSLDSHFIATTETINCAAVLATLTHRIAPRCGYVSCETVVERRAEWQYLKADRWHPEVSPEVLGVQSKRIAFACLSLGIVRTDVIKVAATSEYCCYRTPKRRLLQVDHSDVM